MNYRDFLQKVIYVIINPIIKGMIKIGITPNFITTTGFVLNLELRLCSSTLPRSQKQRLSHGLDGLVA